MPGLLVPADRRGGSRAGSSLRSVNSTASPDFAAQAAAGIANCGSSADTITTFCDGSPADVGRGARRSPAASVERVLAGDAPRCAASPGARAVADLDRLRPAERPGAGRPQRVERGRGGLRHVAAVGEQDRRAQRRRHQHGGGDAGAPVAAVDERHGPRPGAAGLARIDGARGAGGVGDRVLAARRGWCSWSPARGSRARSASAVSSLSCTSTGLSSSPQPAPSASSGAAASAATARRAAGGDHRAATMYGLASSGGRYAPPAAPKAWFRPPQGGTMTVG